MPFMR